MTVRIINADVLDGLSQIADESVHCVVTSPPYWGLRQYIADGAPEKQHEIGLEPTLAEHITKLVEVFREVRRVLRKDGTLWLNYGDAYCATTKGAGGAGKQHSNAGSVLSDRSWSIPDGLKPKDLLMMPERLAIALQESGWYVRARIIWAKPNPMPESVTDRPTKSHEHIWLMSRSPRYFYDAEAIREEANEETRRAASFRDGGVYTNNRSVINDASVKKATHGDGEAGFGRNARDVWTIATSPFPEAHFATFPPELAERCIKAGTSEKGCCAKCGAPLERVQQKGESDYARLGRLNGADFQRSDSQPGNSGQTRLPNGTVPSLKPAQRETLGWAPSCSCDVNSVPCTVLDPFGGSGTTGLVADRLQRSAILIELNPTYAAMARKRVTSDCPLFVEAAE